MTRSSIWWSSPTVPCLRRKYFKCQITSNCVLSEILVSTFELLTPSYLKISSFIILLIQFESLVSTGPFRRTVSLVKQTQDSRIILITLLLLSRLIRSVYLIVPRTITLSIFTGCFCWFSTHVNLESLFLLLLLKEKLVWDRSEKSGYNNWSGVGTGCVWCRRVVFIKTGGGKGCYFLNSFMIVEKISSSGIKILLGSVWISRTKSFEFRRFS